MCNTHVLFTRVSVSVLFALASPPIAYRFVKATGRTAAPQDQLAQTHRSEKALHGNLRSHAVRRNQIGAPVAGLRLVRVARRGCPIPDAGHVHRYGARGQVQHTVGHAARMAVRGVQAL